MKQTEMDDIIKSFEKQTMRRIDELKKEEETAYNKKIIIKSINSTIPLFIAVLGIVGMFAIGTIATIIPKNIILLLATCLYFLIIVAIGSYVEEINKLETLKQERDKKKL